MVKINNLENIIKAYPKWKFTDIAFIKLLNWDGLKTRIIFYSQLRQNANGWPDISGDFFEITMVFHGVINLKLQFDGLYDLQQVTGFDISDVSDHGLEKMNFQIEDYENGVISFSCDRIEIVDNPKPVKIY